MTSTRILRDIAERTAKTGSQRTQTQESDQYKLQKTSTNEVTEAATNYLFRLSMFTYPQTATGCRASLRVKVYSMLVKLLILYASTFTIGYGSRRGDGWMRPMEKDVNPNCWKCEPSPEELSECDPALLTRGRHCGTVRSRFEERGFHCIVEILQCFTKISSANRAEANFIVARGRLIDPSDNDTSLRYFPLSSPAAVTLVVIPCTLNGIWEAVPVTGGRIEVTEVQCIASGVQAMNHISPYINDIYRRRR